MLKVNCECLAFDNPDERIRSITLTNLHDSPLIYKVKTNNLKAFEAIPNYGFIQARTSLSVNIKTHHADPFEAKLQIIYASVGNKTNDFGTEWASLDSSSMRKEQVRILRPSESLEQRDMKNSEHASSAGDLQKFESMHSMQTMELQSRIEEQHKENLKMKQQIEITEEKLREINRERLQIKVNKSIAIICEEYHTSFITLLLYGLAVFVVGYALAKYD